MKMMMQSVRRDIQTGICYSFMLIIAFSYSTNGSREEESDLNLSLGSKSVTGSVAKVRPSSQTFQLEPDQSSLEWLSVGDWGGLPIYPYYTYGQNRVAKQMAAMAEKLRPDFILALGDNFYFTGVKNDNDKRFKRTFEDMYAEPSLVSIPWHVVAGNHDHYGNVSGQIAYTQKSQRWNFPSLYYSLNYQFISKSKRTPGVVAQFLMIDTVTLCGNTAQHHVIGCSSGIMDYLLEGSSPPSGPENVAAAEAQWAWIEEELQKSKADYLFVAGHYPVYSVAEHGPTKCLLERLRPLLKQYNVTAYFSGHDHTLQHLREPNQEGQEQAQLHYVLSGAGAFLDSSKAHQTSVPSDYQIFVYPSSRSSPGSRIGFTNGGFVRTKVTSESAEFTYFSGRGQLLHHFTAERRFQSSS